LKVQGLPEFRAELEYICKILFEYALQRPVDIGWVPIEGELSNVTLINLESSDGLNAEILFPDIFFSKYYGKFLTCGDSEEWITSLAKQFHERVIVDEISVITLPFAMDSPLYHIRDQQIEFSVDILGLLFAAVTRVAELNLRRVDHHDRPNPIGLDPNWDKIYSAPLLEIYSHLLRVAIGVAQTEQVGIRMRVSHDIDHIVMPSKGSFRFWRSAAADFLLRRDTNRAFLKLKKGLNPLNNLVSLANLDEGFALRGTFFIKTGQTNFIYDDKPDVDSSHFLSSLAKIIERGHELGIHPSYETYQSSTLLSRELEVFANIRRTLGVERQPLRCRMHYLRGRFHHLARHLAAVGVEIDSTSGFAAFPGFRSGTCAEFPVFDLAERRQMALIERPFYCMDDSLLDSKGWPLPPSVGSKTLAIWKKIGVELEFIIHNSAAISPREISSLRYGLAAFQKLQQVSDVHM
jgi:hypothetical protein